MTILRTGVSLASAAAVIAITAAAPTVAFAKGSGAGPKIHCYGVNTCKGTSDCKTASNDCKGQNSCKGQGFKEMSAAACKKAGGTTEPK